MPRMNILNKSEQDMFDEPPILNSGERKCFFNIPNALRQKAKTLGRITLKGELSSKHQYLTRSSAKCVIFEYIEVFYNRKRRHSTIKYCTTEDFEQQYTEAKVS